MSRSGYSEDCENLGLWRGAVAKAIHGKRGQEFLKEMLVALDSIPSKGLTESKLESNGEVCAMGAVGLKRGLDMSTVEPYDRYRVAELFGISPAMAAEIAYENDEGTYDHNETPQQRWARMRAWVVKNIAVQP